MNIVDLLLARRKELEAQKAFLDSELKDIAKALDAIADRRGVDAPASAKPSQVQHRMNVDDAIVIAVRDGSKSPSAMLGYLSRNLGVNTTVGSIRTRVSKLRRAGRLARDGEGWVLPDPELKMSNDEDAVGPSLLEYKTAPAAFA